MKGNLLIIDDEPILLKTMQFSLKKTADQVFTAVDSKAALEIMKTEKIHCVLSDYSMPLMTGIELVQELRAKGNNVPFIIFTGHASDEQMRIGASLNVFEFIEKPLFAGLVETVKLALTLGLEPRQKVDFSKLTHKSQYRILREREKL